MPKSWTLKKPSLTIANSKPLSATQQQMMLAWLGALGLSESDVRFSYDDPDIGFGVAAKISLPAWHQVQANPNLKREIWQATKHLVKG